MKETREGGIIETAERIVIDYANFSGRESANRSEFRKSVINHLEVFRSQELTAQREEIMDFIEKNEFISDDLAGGIAIDADDLKALITKGKEQ